MISRVRPRPSNRKSGFCAGFGPRLRDERRTCLLIGCWILVIHTLLTAAPGAMEGQWTSYLNAGDIRGLASDERGIWCATGGGALFFDPATGSMTRYGRTLEGLASDSLVAVAVDPDGLIAFGTAAAGVSFFDPEYEIWYPRNSLTWALGSDRILCLRQQEHWQVIGSRGGFVARRDGEVKRICQEGLDICGLPSWEVRAGLYHDGFLWLGTVPGVDQLGGVCRLNYDNPGPPLGVWDTLNTGLSNLAVTDLEVYDGALYCATESDLRVWDGTEWRNRRAGLPSSGIITDLYAGQSGFYAGVAGTNHVGGVFRFDPAAQSWARVGTISDDNVRKEFYVTCLLEAFGTLWAGTSMTYSAKPFLREREEGLWELSGEEWIQHRHDGPHFAAYYHAITADDQGRLFAAAAISGRWHITRFDPGLEESWKNFTQYNTDVMSNAWVQDLRAADGKIWVGRCCCSNPADKCYLDVWDLGSDAIETYPEMFNIWDSAQDPWGNFWFASYRESPEENPDVVRGLFHWRRDVTPPEIIQYTMESTGAQLRSNGIAAVAGEGNSLWIGYPGQGLSRLRLAEDGSGPWPFGDPWTHYNAEEQNSPLAGNRVRTLASPADGEIWIGTDNGISIRTAGQWRTLTVASGLPGSQIIDIAFAHDGAAWVAIGGQGVTRVTRDERGVFAFETFTEPDLTYRYPTAITPGAQGTDVWVATQWGLSHFVPHSSVRVEAQAGLPIYPNPFNPRCGQDAAFVRLPGRVDHGVIVDPSGRVVARLGDIGGEPPYRFWDGRDLDGEVVAAGIYVVRVATPQGWLSGSLAVLDLPCDGGY